VTPVNHVVQFTTIHHDLLINTDNAADSCICSCTSERYFYIFFLTDQMSQVTRHVTNVRALKEREAQGEPE